MDRMHGGAWGVHAPPPPTAIKVRKCPLNYKSNE